MQIYQGLSLVKSKGIVVLPICMDKTIDQGCMIQYLKYWLFFLLVY